MYIYILYIYIYVYIYVYIYILLIFILIVEHSGYRFLLINIQQWETQCYGYLLFLITSYILHCSINYNIEHST